MKAYIRMKYGSSEVLVKREIPIPVPEGDEVLIKLYATSINSADYEYMKGNLFARVAGLFNSGGNILGSDVSGVIEAVGASASQFKVGDAVIGDMSEYKFGTFAEYKCVTEKALMLKPASLSFEEAAALPSAGVIALQAVNRVRPIRAGEKVLINGAGGGMGAFATQLAKLAGAVITAVDRGEKADLLIRLGAQTVIDFTQVDYTKNNEKYDRIIDCQCYHSISKYPSLLNKDGIYSMIGGSTGAILKAFAFSKSVSKRTQKHIGIVMGQMNKHEDMTYLIEQIEKGNIKPIVDQSFDFNNLPEAMSYFEKGLYKGKVIITF